MNIRGIKWEDRPPFEDGSVHGCGSYLIIFLTIDLNIIMQNQIDEVLYNHFSTNGLLATRGKNIPKLVATFESYINQVEEERKDDILEMSNISNIMD